MTQNTQQKTTLKGLTCLKYHEMEYKLRRFFQNRKLNNNFKSLKQQATIHYSKVLKVPLILKNDSRWNKEKEYRQKLKLQVNNKLPIDYIDNFNGKYYYRNVQLENCKTDTDSNPQNSRLKQLLKRFNQKTFANAELSHLYTQGLERKFEMKKMQRVNTLPNKISYSESAKSPLLKNTKSILSPSQLSLKKTKTNSTASILRRGNFTERTMKLSRLSKMNSYNENTSRLIERQIQKVLTYDLKESIDLLKQLLNVNTKQEITKELLQQKLKIKYGNEVRGLPLTVGMLGNIHMKSTLQNLCKIALNRVHKICFLFFDTNKNGVIDEYDLFQILRKIDEIPLLEKDYRKFAIYLSQFNNIVNDEVSPMNTSRLSKMNSRSISKQSINLESQILIKKQEDYQSPKIFTLLTNQIEKGPKKQYNYNQKSSRIGINFKRFQLIFRNERPSIFYEFLSTFFGITVKNQSMSRINIQSNNIEIKKYDSNEQQKNLLDLAFSKLEQMKLESTNFQKLQI